MTITNQNCTISGTLAIELDGSRVSDNGTLDVDGTLDISAGTSTLDINVTSPAYGNMVLARFNSRNGEFAVTNGLPDNAVITYSATAITMSLPPQSGLLFITR